MTPTAKMALLTIACAALAAALVYVALRLRVADLEERLVQEANSVVGAPRLRRLHTDHPIQGSLGQALAEHLPPFEEARRAQSDDKASQAALREVLEGERPLSRIPAFYLETLTRLNADLDGVLGASRAERAELALAPDSFDVAPGASFAGYQFAAWLAGIRVRQAVAAGRSAAAFDDCLDVLALARDAAISGGLIGRMVNATMVERIAPTCAVAIDTLPDAGLAEALGRLRRVRNAVPGFEVTMREEAVQMQLYLRGPWLGDAFRSRLADRPKLMAKGFGGSMDERSRGRRLLERVMWRDCVAVYDELVAKAALPAPERDTAFEVLAARIEGRWSWIAEELPKPREYLRFARRADAALLRLDLIMMAAAAKSFRATLGTWPTSVDALADKGLLTAEEQRRVAAAGFLIEDDRVSIAIPLPQANEESPGEARIHLGT
jgi:hypothetical protein